VGVIKNMTVKIKNTIYKFAPKSVDLKIGDTYGNMIKDENGNVTSVIIGRILDEESRKFHNELENARLLFNLTIED
jgi:hypothetical protein